MATPAPNRSNSESSVTAMDYINEQLQLESDAREALPYAFDTCTRPLGRLRQPIYACRTCLPLNPTTPPRFGQTKPHGAAALCYSCSIQCHGDHELVEIFEKRDVVCDCGTKRLPGARCLLRKAQDEEVQGDGEARYGQNFWGKFCQCEVQYDPQKEKGTMFQCFLGDVCSEDWFHDVCVVGSGPPEYDNEKADEKKEKAPVELTVDKSGALAEVEVGEEAASNGEVEESASAAGNPAAQTAEDEDERDEMIPGFPKEDFEHFICWRCVEANPWLPRYAGTPGFFPVVVRQGQAPTKALASAPTASESASSEPPKQPSHPAKPSSYKRKATEDPASPLPEPQPKRARAPDRDSTTPAPVTCRAPTKALASAPTASESASSEPPKQPSHPAKPSSPRRKATEDPASPLPERARAPDRDSTTPAPVACRAPKYSSPSQQPVSLLLKEDFRTHLCRCSSCFPLLSKHRALLEVEHTYEPPLSGAPSSTGSLYDRGEKALGSIDRVRAIEGVMAYNMLKEKVKAFLQPFAESGQPVGKEDVEAYFEALKENGATGGSGESSVGVKGNGRKEEEAK